MVYTVFYKTSSFAGYCFLDKNSIHPKRYGVFSIKAFIAILVKFQICSFIVNELIEQVETEEEKIKRLKKEKDVLLDYIKNETKRISKIERKKILEADAKRILDEYKEVAEELNAMSNMEIDLDNVSKEIQELYNIQGKNSKEEEVVDVEQGRNLVILGLNYTAQGFLDIYRLPVEILVDLIDKFMNILSEGLHELAKRILNLLKRF